jgi:polyisoprenoid-binding protein YceI
MNTTYSTASGAATAQDERQLFDAKPRLTTYDIDPANSRVEFAIRKRLFFVTHLMVVGRFSDVRGSVSLDEQEPANSRADVTIGAASVSTKMGKRDKHLRNADFFDVERFPRLVFLSRRIETIDRTAGHYRVVGDLTVHGMTREVTLDAHYVPEQPGGGAPRISLKLTTALNRRDFGMVWNNPLMHVADDLTVNLVITATRVALPDTQ